MEHSQKNRKRSFKKCLRVLLGISLLFLANTISANPTRISVLQFSKDTQKVEAFEKAIADMRTDGRQSILSAPFRTSLVYWANTHGFLGSDPNATNLQGYISFRMPGCQQTYGQEKCDSYYGHMVNTPIPDDGFTKDVWGTCEHGTIYFLPWHRLYLHFFEKTLRKRIGDENFALPYWSYYDEKGKDGKGIALPEMTRGLKAGSFYNPYRTPGLNDNTDSIDEDYGSAQQAFDETTFQKFSESLEVQPHGMMHCGVGSGCNAPDMGFVPIAGQDPIFYMHHANIDRLWQCWLRRKANGARIDLAWAKANLGMDETWYQKEFSFADENGDLVTISVADVFDPELIEPNYAQETNCVDDPASMLLSAQAKSAQPQGRTLKAHSPKETGTSVSLKNEAVTVTLETQKSNKTSALLSAPAPVGNTILFLENVEIHGSPAVNYKIYLSSKSNPANAIFLSGFNYFSIGGHDAHGGQSKTMSFNITNSLRELNIQSADDVTVQFIPTHSMTGKSKALETKSTSVTIGNIRLETSQ